MKIIFIGIYYEGWNKIEDEIIYESYNIPVPVKGNIIYINNTSYEVKEVSYHLYTNEDIKPYIKVELFEFK
jgi:hypothetical protein